jgi:hypothetical protein
MQWMGRDSRKTVIQIETKAFEVKEGIFNSLQRGRVRGRLSMNWRFISFFSNARKKFLATYFRSSDDGK